MKIPWLESELSDLLVKSLPCTPLLTLSPPCTLYIISRYLWWHVVKKHSTHILQWVTLQWSLSTVNFEMISQPVEHSKKVKCFLCLIAWDGLPSLQESFCLWVPPTPTPEEFIPASSSWILFILWPRSTLSLNHNWHGLVTEANKQSLVMLNCKTCPVKDLK